MARNHKDQEIIEASRDLFYKYGIKKVTVEDICKQANVSKMTFYKYFPNKIELAKKMISDLIESALARYWDVFRSDIPFAEKMHQVLEIKVSGAGNASVEFIYDIYKSEDETMKAFMDDWIARSLKETTDMFSYAQEQGWMRKDLKPELLLEISNQLTEIGKNPKLLGMYDNVQDFIRELTKFFLYGVFDQE